MKSMLSPTEVGSLILKGETLLLAGSEKSLRQLPLGNWIGGTIPYFMTDTGGCVSHELILATSMDKNITDIKIQNYSKSSISELPKSYFKNGFSLIIIPGFSEIHHYYAAHVWEWPGLFNQPLVGWVSGHDLKENSQTPLVFNGLTGEVFNDQAVVIHAELDSSYKSNVNIINIFDQTKSDIITFEESGFDTQTAIINGKKVNLADYLNQNNVDIKWPLVSDFNGEKINVSFRDANKDTNTVRFYAPVFKGVEYRFSTPIQNYEDKFLKSISAKDIQNIGFSCNCVLNFVHANLEGKKMGPESCAMTFGEIAFLLLNQTYVYLTIDKK